MELKDKLQRIYDQLPKIECKQKCQEACSLIVMTKNEKKAIEKEVGESITHKIDRFHYALFDPGNLGKEIPACKMLDGCGSCSIYQLRPLICRLFGLVKKMECPFGCVPERWLSDAEAKLFFKRIKNLK